MKPLLKTGFALCLLGVLLACTPPARDVAPAQRPLRALEDIDSMMWQQPDSAFAMLLAFAASPAADSLAGLNGHYFQLLVSELLYKNDYAQSNREDLLRAVDYFDTTDNAFLTARSHYINGVGYYECDSVVKACGEYLRALEVMEDRYEEKELEGPKAKFMALTCTRLCEVYSHQYLHQQAIHFGKLSLPYYNRCNSATEQWHIARILEEIGSNYDILERLDSADFYYQQAALSLTDTNCLTYRDLQAHRVLLSYRLHDNTSEYALGQLRELLRLSEGQAEHCARCVVIGEVFYSQRQYDSAWSYFSRAFGGTENVLLKKQVAENLVEICDSLKLDSEKYLGFLVPLVNEEENKSVTKTLLAEQYGSHLKTAYEQSRRNEARGWLRKTAVAIAALTILLVVYFSLYHASKKKKKHLAARLDEERQAHQMKQRALGGRLKKSGKALRVQKKKNRELLKELESKENQTKWSGYDEFLNEPICQTILSLLQGKHVKRGARYEDYPELKLSQKQLTQVESAVEKHFSGFGDILIERYPKISRNETLQCMLCLLNLQDAQIAALLQNDYSTIRKRSSRIQNALGTEKPLQVYLRGLVL